jgi:hypothetical protein
VGPGEGGVAIVACEGHTRYEHLVGSGGTVTTSTVFTHQSGEIRMGVDGPTVG